MSYTVQRVPFGALSPGMTFIASTGAPIVVTHDMLNDPRTLGLWVDALIPEADPAPDPLAMQRAILLLLQAFPQSEILEVAP